MSDNWQYGPPGPGYPGDPNDPYGGGYPPPYPPPHPPPGGYYVEPPSRGIAIGALVTSIILAVSCCNLVAIAGLVFSSLALSESHDHEKAERYTRYAWISNGVAIGVFVLLGALFFTLVLAA